MQVCGTTNEGNWTHTFCFTKYDMSQPGVLNEKLREVKCDSADVLVSVVRKYITSEAEEAGK